MRIAMLAAIGLAAIAGGCISPAEQRALDEERCRSYGFRPGSEGLAQCRMEVDLDRAAERRAFTARDPWLYGPGFGYGLRRW